MVPASLKGADFEKLVQDQCAIYEENKIACIGRYGVQAARTKDDWVIMQSLPDFEGSMVTGLHIVFDAKVCSGASFPWDRYRPETRGSRSRQLRHMIRRSRFGAKCFFLVHWNERKLSKKTISAATFVVPVHHGFEYWHKVEGGEIKSLTQDDCRTIGMEVAWVKKAQGSTYRPDFIEALVGMELAVAKHNTGWSQQRQLWAQQHLSLESK